ncbi:response regulator [Clostridium estertheticum]|uniref:response regulator n=1 Tax=Clostridium estertheticum TaxID=238834 RepID=UPI001C0E3A85|nr:response regulator [Clostridium estertheticum]MBU3201334.1 response regulator [Clostridium estertheticum]WAG66661.1 response regulator [Clostridium estertheticum]
MCNIIIVDDEILVRLGIKSYIEDSKEFTVVNTFSNGKDALEYCKKSKPDIVLTDITMPIMDGMQLIQELKKIYNDIKIVVLTCHDDFKLIRGAFKQGADDYILKYEIEENGLIDILLKIKEQIFNEKGSSSSSSIQIVVNLDEMKKSIISELMNLQQDDFVGEELQNKILTYCKRLGSNNLILVMLGIDEEYDEEFFEIKNGFDLKSVISVIDEIFNRYGLGEVFIDKDLRIIVLLTIEEENSKKVIFEKVNYLIENICISLNEYFNCSISVGISKMHNSLVLVKKAYTEAEEAFSFRFYNGKGSIVYYEPTMKFNSITDINNIKKIQDNIIDKSNYSFNKTKMVQSIQQYFKYMKEQEISPSIFRQEVNNILYSINFYLLEYFDSRLDQNVYNSKNITPSLVIEDIKYASIIEKYIIFCLEQIEQNIQKQSTQIKLINKIKTYIDNHYSEELSLKFMSEEFHLNKNYLCQYFKKEMNKNFIDYLTQLRIEKAKMILKDESLSAIEVSERVGFNSVNYFVKVFKKTTGKNITEYKKS